MSRRLLLIPIILFLVLFAVVWPGIASTLTDWWWFREIGYQVIFTKEITTRVLLFLGVFAGTSALFYANFRVAQRGLAMVPFSVQLGPGVPPLNVASLLRRLSLPIALVFGVLFGMAGSSAWETILLAMDRSPFGTVDPVFGRDISYYVFTLPAVSGILIMLTVLAFFALALLFPTYFLRGDITLAPRKVHMAPAASRHVAILLASFFVLIALDLWFVDIPSLLYSTSGPQMVGASYTDLHATLPALRLSAIVALLAAGRLIYGSVRGHLVGYGIQAVVVYALVAIVGRGVYPALMQKFFVAPTELTRETPYLKYHLAATRRAWGLDSVEIKELGDAGTLSLADIRNNAPTIENVRLWDRDPLLQTFGQLQEIRTYYDFINVDDDRYWIDGRYRQVLLSPRELNAASLPQRTFINEHLTYTHGMGLTLGPVNQVTSEGLPVLFVKDLPPASSVSIKVTRPQIYFGEINYDYAVVGTKEREFDHPAGEDNVYAAYAGSGGVKVGSLLRRAVMATTFGTSKILFSADIGDESKILYYRNIMQRARKALPFVTFDRDPYLVVADDGSLKWLLDAYTSSDRYPYSHRVGGAGINYMRNSVKVVLDAYDGSLRAFVSAPEDPLIRTWGRIFPGILHPIDSMPEDLRRHLRYPDELFQLQTSLYATYHLDSAATFYLREDQWAVPAMDAADGSVPFMRHMVMRLPGEKDAEFVYMVPFTPRGKENLAAWMVARNDGAEYGKLRVYKLSRTSLVFGPTQIENRINQNTQISQQVSLWDQRGSKVLRGDLLVIPIEGSLLYVQPLYLQAEGGKIPELKRVVVAYQNQVVMQETLDGALNEMFGGAPGTGKASDAAGNSAAARTPADAAANIQSLISEARQRYDNAVQAQREGDWARYGEEIRALGQVLERLKAAQGKE